LRLLAGSPARAVDDHARRRERAVSALLWQLWYGSAAGKRMDFLVLSRTFPTIRERPRRRLTKQSKV
jgi:hypothetical protein